MAANNKLRAATQFYTASPRRTKHYYLLLMACYYAIFHENTLPAN